MFSLLLEVELLGVSQRRKQFAELLLQLCKDRLVGLVLLVEEQVALLKVVFVCELHDFFQQTDKLFEV